MGGGLLSSNVAALMEAMKRREQIEQQQEEADHKAQLLAHASNAHGKATEAAGAAMSTLRNLGAHKEKEGGRKIVLKRLEIDGVAVRTTTSLQVKSQGMHPAATVKCPKIHSDNFSEEVGGKLTPTKFIEHLIKKIVGSALSKVT